MRVPLINAGRAAYALAVAATLVFGATAARAEARPSACGEFGANGSCTTTTGCAKLCKGIGAGTGQCSSGCCYCIWF